MREITLHPGESLTIDGLTIKCAHKPNCDEQRSFASLCSQRVTDIVAEDLLKNGPIAQKVKGL